MKYTIVLQTPLGERQREVWIEFLRGLATGLELREDEALPPERQDQHLAWDGGGVPADVTEGVLWQDEGGEG